MGPARYGLLALLAIFMARPAQPNIDRLTHEARASFLRFDLRPFPAVRIVAEEGRLLDGEYARAVLYDSGREEIWIRASTADLDELHSILDHEAAHLRAWRDHGPNIPEHGFRWLKTCRTHALSLKACEDRR